MNKSESRYFKTALRMNEALISLLEVKDLEYISVKEICQTAGVNRSTFYLHYETLSDLVSETLETINKRFEAYFPESAGDVLKRPGEQEKSALFLVTRAYLLPYLRFIKENQNIYRAAYRSPVGMQCSERYGRLKRHILSPILQRFGVPDGLQEYYMAYYIEGISAIIRRWIDRNCEEEIETIAGIIQRCVRSEDDAHDMETGTEKRRAPV